MSNPVLRNGPVVCAAGEDYQIMIPLKKKALIKIKVGDRFFYDHSNGIRRSDAKVQRFNIPMQLLDEAGKYIVIYEEMIKRMPYSCIKGEAGELEYNFYPVLKKDKVNAYYVSDCHGMNKETVSAATYFGDALDMMILNGDVSSSCATFNEAMLPYDIAFKVTKGEKPCIITRGNHDLRGKLSEKLYDLMPGVNGKAYYLTELGDLSFLVLDCGEDKNDDHKEYSGTAAFHAMRLDETDFIRKATENYNGEGKRRIVLSHIPFYNRDRGTCRGEAPFDIENEVYSEWTDLINTNYKPELAIAGHMHRNGIYTDDESVNFRKINCNVLVSGKPDHDNNNFYGSAITFLNDKIEIKITDKKHTVIDEYSL